MFDGSNDNIMIKSINDNTESYVLYIVIDALKILNVTTIIMIIITL